MRPSESRRPAQTPWRERTRARGSVTSNYSDYDFQQNDVITLISGSYQLGNATNGIWVSPGSTYSITANSISTATENSPSYSSSFVTAVPEPSISAMAVAGLACGGYSLFRRRRTC